jgi:hypothetical protein
VSRLIFGADVAPDGKPVPMAFVGRAACGHVRAVLVDSGRPDAVAEAASWALAEGLTVERIPVVDVQGIGGCDVCRPAEQQGMGL